MEALIKIVNSKERMTMNDKIKVKSRVTDCDDWGQNYPEAVKRAIKRVYNSFPVDSMPQGLCDPIYIMNVICLELGIGDGMGNFKLPK